MDNNNHNKSKNHGYKSSTTWLELLCVMYLFFKNQQLFMYICINIVCSYMVTYVIKWFCLLKFHLQYNPKIGLSLTLVVPSLCDVMLRCNCILPCLNLYTCDMMHEEEKTSGTSSCALLKIITDNHLINCYGRNSQKSFYFVCYTSSSSLKYNHKQLKMQNIISATPNFEFYTILNKRKYNVHTL